jgi:hypothetical protein
MVSLRSALPRALAVLLLASCATTPPVTLGNGGNGGGGATTTLPPSTGGSGGSPFGNGGSPPFVDAGACSAFAETFVPACLGCLAANCCSVALACSTVPDCFGYTSCQQNCPPSTTDGGVDGGTNPCLAACTTNFPMAQPAFGTMQACLQTSCAGICP